MSTFHRVTQNGKELTYYLTEGMTWDTGFTAYSTASLQIMKS